MIFRLAVIGCVLVAAPAAAQTYPAKTVRIVVGFTPGGSTDIVARIVAQRLGEAWGQQVIVDNRPGAGANIAAEHVSKSAPDGHTLLVTQNSLAVSPSLYGKLGYDARKDLTAVTPLASSPHILIVHPSLPVKNVRELIALARTRPGELTFASSGVGINDHMAGELFRTMTKVDVIHVPYKGGGQAGAELRGGQISFYFAGMPVGLPMYKDGRVRALAVTGKERYGQAKELPTMEEAGLSGYDVVLWQGVFAPSAIDPKLAARISSDTNRILQRADIGSTFESSGLVPFAGSPESFKAFYEREYAKWAKVVKAANIRVE